MNKLCQECRYNSELDFLWCERKHKIIRRENCVLKKQDNMKDLIKSWKFWLIVAAVVLAIVAVVLYFTVPKFAQVVGGALVGFIIGFATGYFVGKKK